MKTILVFATLFISCAACSQTESLNQFDANGRKHGEWIVWLDKDWKLAKDSMSAAYYRYNYFDHGHSIYAMGPWGGKGIKLETDSASGLKKGNARMLDGVYKWYNSKGELRSEHILSGGHYVSFKEYYPDGKVQTFFDYTRKLNGREHTYYFCTYNKKGELTYEGWEAKDEKGNYLPSKGVDN